ncbi:hypothetical protein HRI_001640500 [Hibiscus trionum]|uniref:Uncharacterized protein n=1 Tax=Hibiscus trionum TaxID=183268 RepID=A0A9W7LVX8_HIBTR|nr:hypothetical protein HRI_001640500 [Hibiscus trionum]
MWKIKFIDELGVNIMIYVLFESFPEKLSSVSYKLLQASSDPSILDSDIPFALVFVAAGATEVMATTGFMDFITWQVLIVTIVAMVAVNFIQVDKFSCHLLCSNTSFLVYNPKFVSLEI